MKKIKILKEKLKRFAVSIRKVKQFHKECQKKHNWEEVNATRWQYQQDQHEFRHMHIAYCMLRGRKYEEIEQKTKEGNAPSMDYVADIMHEYMEVHDEEDVRASA